jgi:AraC family transcriptional regulator of adaptative response / DNA-3-methyladenine glycosylase II
VGDDELCYRAVLARDSRFDGWFFVAVRTTGIYCRPSCASVTPKRQNVSFFPTAAAAQRAGFRACKRCRPDASPGSPEWNRRGDVVARAMRAIADGLVDREGVGGLARLLGYSERHLNRLVTAELGAGPLELARAQRAQTARVLIETTTLDMGAVAFGAGFSSIRQFNDTIRAVFGETPSRLRQRGQVARRLEPAPSGALSLRLAFRRPYDHRAIFSFLAARAVPGLERADTMTYERVLDLPHGLAAVLVQAPSGEESHLRAIFRLSDLRDLTTAVKRLRQLFDLDSDPKAVAEVLGGDKTLGHLVAARPGLRVPGSVDARELAFRAVLGQQVSVAGARHLTARLVGAAGLKAPGSLFEDGAEPLSSFPSPEAVASLAATGLPMPAGRRLAMAGLARAITTAELDLSPGADREQVRRLLLSLPGIGPWTAGYVAMRGLGDPDAFLPSDLGVKRALESLGRPGGPTSALSLAEAWRPYRAYGLLHLWSIPTKPADARRKENVA